MNWKSFLGAFVALFCSVSPSLAKIEVGQALDIRIMGVPREEKEKIDASYPVAKDGTVNLPFLGKVNAAGLQADELAKVIEAAYMVAEIYAEPEINVITNLKGGDDMGPQVVHVGGQVRRPGPCVFKKGMTLFQAVQAAGGPTEFGAINRVRLWRKGKEQKIDLTKPEGKDLVTEPQDAIEVPQRNFIGDGGG